MKKILLKVHPSLRGSAPVVAICDNELLGKKFESRGLILDLETCRRFYDGEPVAGDEVAIALQESVNVNAVGERSVAIACKALGISTDGAKKIGGVPHLQIYRID